MMNMAHKSLGKQHAAYRHGSASSLPIVLITGIIACLRAAILTFMRQVEPKAT